MKKISVISTLMVAFLFTSCGESIEAPKIIQIPPRGKAVGNIVVQSSDNNTIINDVIINEGNCQMVHAYNLNEKVFLELLQKGLVEEKRVEIPKNDDGPIYSPDEFARNKQGIELKFLYYVEGIKIPIIEFSFYNDFKNFIELGLLTKEQYEQIQNENKQTKNKEKLAYKKIVELNHQRSQEYRKKYEEMQEECMKRGIMLSRCPFDSIEKVPDITEMKEKQEMVERENLRLITEASFLKDLLENNPEKINQVKSKVFQEYFNKGRFGYFKFYNIGDSVLDMYTQSRGFGMVASLGKLNIDAKYKGLYTDLTYPKALKFGDTSKFRVWECDAILKIELVTNGGDFTYEFY